LADKQEEKDSHLEQVLRRLLALLPVTESVDWQRTPAAVWRANRWHGGLVAGGVVDDIDLRDLLHIDDQREQLLRNTEQLLRGLPANNALLWGARGTGKSSLIHALLNEFFPQGLRLVEVHKEQLSDLPGIVGGLSRLPYKFIVFCDDLSFEVNDASYKALKSALEGSVLKTSDNVLIYATSNRRHLVPEHQTDNQSVRVAEGELHESEAVEEKISLSDRFGLWLSFYPFRQEAYLQVVGHWVTQLAQRHGVSVDLNDTQMRAEALRWALARGTRNGRTAQYFARHWIGQIALQKS